MADRELNVSMTVHRVRENLEDRGPIPAWTVAEEILKLHEEYANYAAGELLKWSREQPGPLGPPADAVQQDSEEGSASTAETAAPPESETGSGTTGASGEPPPTKPVTDWLEAVQSLLSEQTPPPRLHGRLVLLGLALLDDSVRALLQYEDFLPTLLDETTDFESAVSVPEWPAVLGVDRPVRRERTPLLDDRPIADPSADLLNRRAFAAYLADLMDEVATTGDLEDGAYAIHLSGDWGVGKSSVLHLLQDELEGPRTPRTSGEDADGEQPRASDAARTAPVQRALTRAKSAWSAAGDTDRTTSEAENDGGWTVIRFNAWENQHTNPPWWALLDTVYQKSRPTLRPAAIGRELLWRWSRPRLGTIAAVVTFVLLLTGLIVVVLGFVANVDLSSEQIGAIAAVLTLMWPFSMSVSKLVVLRSSQGTESYIRYASNPFSTIKTRFRRLIERIDDDQVAIFIDDVDRCESEYLVGLLEGIHTLFRGAPVVFVVAGDRDWIDTSFEEVYDSQARNHTAFGRSLGTRFLEKTFQFTAPVPQISEPIQRTFVESVTDRHDTDGADGPDRSAVATHPSSRAESSTASGSTTDEIELSADALAYWQAIEAASDEAAILETLERTTELPIAEQRVLRERAVRKFGTLDVRADTEYVLLQFTPLLEPNPRAIKRLVNTYGINRVLATLAHADVSQNQLALWSVLSMRWPDLASTLSANPTLLSADTDDVATDHAATPAAAGLLDHPDVRAVLDWEPDPLTPDTVRECAKIWG